MRVSLLTFHGALNYGAVWQAYALTRVIRNMGHNVRIIDLRLPWDWPRMRSFKGLKQHLHPIIRQKRKMFIRFLQDNFPPFTMTYRIPGEMRRNIPPGDVFVVGSDQVWNPNNTRRFMCDYFFESVPDHIRKISYAASFGQKDIPFVDEQQRRVCSLLKRFDAVSVRERSGVDICHALANVSAVQVLDPVFLLPKSDYSRICSHSFIPANALVSYKFNQGPGFIDALDYVSKEIGYVAYVLNCLKINDLLTRPLTLINDRFKKRNLKLIWCPSPERWLAGLRKSSFIFTDSFHGTAFAIIFRKNFIVTINNKKRFTRIEELLKELNLEDRIFHSYEEIKSDHRWKAPIDYNKVDVILSKKIEFSVDFLRNSLCSSEK